MSPSSTSISRAIRIRLLCLLYVGLLVGLAVGVDRVIASAVFVHPNLYVPTYRAYYHPTVGVKLNMLQGQERSYDAWFFGNSVTMTGVDPLIVDHDLGSEGVRLRSFNLAFPSVGVEFWPRFVTRVMHGYVPRYIFLGVEPRDVDARGYAQADLPVEKKFFGSEGYLDLSMSGVARFAEEILSRVYILWARRGSFTPSVLHGVRVDPDDLIVSNSGGWSRIAPQFLRDPARLAAARRALGRRRGPAFFRLAPQAEDSLRTLARLTSRRGGRLVVFSLPILYDPSSWGSVDVHRQFLIAMHSVFRRLPDAVFLDLGDHLLGSYRATDFGDPNHLDRAGAQKFSAQLAHALDPLVR